MALKQRLRLTLSALPLLWPLSATTQEATITSAARAIHDSAIVIDAHADTPFRMFHENYDIASPDPRDPEFISLDKARTGNLAAVFFSIFVVPRPGEKLYATTAFEIIDTVYLQAARHSDRMMMAFSSEDIERAHAQHKLAALMGLEGGHCIENNLSLLRDFQRLGVRYMTLSWSVSNDWADSGDDLNDATVTHHNGLTDFGKQVVAEMNRIGMIVDISHVSDKTFWDAIAIARAPLIASHSSARALLDASRNMSDDMLRAVAKNGGVVNVAFPGSFVDPNFNQGAIAQHQRMLTAAAEYNQKRQAAGFPVTPDDTQRFDLEWLAQNSIPRAPLKSLIDHIHHVAKVAGIDHVGLGSDFNGTAFLPAGIDTAADYPKITQALLDRGYIASDIKKILGGNMLRVLREVVAKSRELQAEHQ